MIILTALEATRITNRSVDSHYDAGSAGLKNGIGEPLQNRR
jgi:hypothetical protein